MRGSLLLVAFALGALPAAGDPSPVGRHDARFWQGTPGPDPYRELRYRGVDPTLDPADGCDKVALVRALRTYPVGLPDGLAPDDLPHAWTDGSRVEPDEIAAFPSVTLSGVAGPVTLLSDMDFTGLGEIDFRGDMRVACVRCALDAFELSGDASGEPELWLVDSVVDAASGDPTTDPPTPGAPAAARPFAGALHVLYSELLGGIDAVKLASRQDWFRNHLHGVQRIGDAHNDLIQGQTSTTDVFIAENTLDGMFRYTNATLFLGGADAVYDRIDVVRNVLSGGASSIRVSPEVSQITRFVVWGNAFLADADRVSWGVPSQAGSFPIAGLDGSVTWGEVNTTTGGVVAGVEQLGRPWDLAGVNVAPVPQVEKDRIDGRIALLETWASELRSAVAPPTCCRCDTDLDQITGDPDFFAWLEESELGCEGAGPTAACDTDCNADGLVDLADGFAIWGRLGRICGGCPHSGPVDAPPPPPDPTRACSNGVDDDGDGRIDFAEDLGCRSPYDASERHSFLACDDGHDGDGDGLVDFPADPGCASPCATRENPDCSDGEDDDGDGLVDFPEDPGCESLADPSERSPQTPCDNGVDDDGDGAADFPADPGCDDVADPSERTPTLVCDDGIDQDGDGVADFPGDPGCDDVFDPDERSAALACDDGVDQDGDGAADFPDDPGCDSPGDVSERAAGRPCDDGIDDDGDGLVDFPADPGCANPSWPSEITACSDGLDNDGDGAADFPSDADCAAPSGLREQGLAAACANGLDDDGDGLVDLGADPGCAAADDPSERDVALVCDDGIDQDGDGAIDYPADAGCASPTDGSETGVPGEAPACDDGVDNDGDGRVDAPSDPGCATPGDASERTADLACDNGLDDDASGAADFPDDPGCVSAMDPLEGAAPPVGPLTPGPVAVFLSAESARLAWETNDRARGWVLFAPAGGPAAAGGSWTWARTHRVRVDGLACDTPYALEVSSIDAVGHRTTPFRTTLATPECDTSEALVAHWRFDEGVGDRARSAVAAGPVGVLTGAVWDADSADGSPFSLRFDGADDRLDLGVLELDGAAASIAAWFKVRAFGREERDGRFLSKATGVLDEEHFWMLATLADGPTTRLRSRVRVTDSVQVTLAEAGDVVPGRWMHAALVYDGKEVRLYLDGVEVGREATVGALEAGPQVAAAAGNQPPGAGDRPLDGWLDDVRLYRRALDPVEIAALYGGQALVVGPETVTASPTAAAFAWTGDQPSVARLELGTTPALELLDVVDDRPARHHRVHALGLAPGTLHHYRITSTSGSGFAVQRVGSFETPVRPPVPALPVAAVAALGLGVVLAGAARLARRPRPV